MWGGNGPREGGSSELENSAQALKCLEFSQACKLLPQIYSELFDPGEAYDGAYLSEVHLDR